MAILLSINRYNCHGINTISHNWTNSFSKFFASYSSDGADSRTITLSSCNSYLPSHDLEISIFERVWNCNNSALSCNLQSPDPKSCSNRESQVLCSKEASFAGLSDLDLQKSQKSMSKELQNHIFDRLSNSDLLKFTIRQLQNPSKAGTLRSSPPLYLLTT